MSDTDAMQLDFVFNEKSDAKWHEKFRVEVWCDGRNYDPSSEAYRAVYSYKITGPNWEYIGNDIFGLPNKPTDIPSATKSLLAFLVACQEGLPEDTDAERENAEMFPEYVREFAYLLKEELLDKYRELEKGEK